jgi:hypothetical protein
MQKSMHMAALLGREHELLLGLRARYYRGWAARPCQLMDETD